MTTAAGEGQAQRDSLTPGVQRQPHRGPAGADEARLLLGEGRQAPKERRMERKTEQGREGLGRGKTACPGASLCRELARGWSRSPS